MNLADFKREAYNLANQLVDGPDAEHVNTIKQFVDELVPAAPEPEPETTVTVSGTAGERAAALMAEVQKLLAEEQSVKQEAPSTAK